MNTSYIVYLTSFLFSLMMAFSLVGSLKPPVRYRAAVAQFVCDICTVYRNPGSYMIRVYDFRGGEIVIDDDLVLLNRGELWIFPYCGKQEDNIIYLPVDVDVPLKASGLSCLRLENLKDKVRVEPCSVVRENG